MIERWIDFRSDTVTKPTPAMREVMNRAEVGDDVYSEDPTINALQEAVAAYFGMEAALFVPSGTMSNQIAIKCHTQPGDELLCEATNHIFIWEAGAPAMLSGVTTRIIEGQDGILEPEQFLDKIRPGNEHYARTRLVCLENTHNRGGGRVYPVEKVAKISSWARSNGLGMHLDGARIWNAIVASGVGPKEWAKHFDTISVCFSKGLGAPVGSALLGPKSVIQPARKLRKIFGGAMRQAGFLAAGALYALENHVDRLKIDHENAKTIATAIELHPAMQLRPGVVETNLVWFEIDPSFGTAHDLGKYLESSQIRCHVAGPQSLRLCTHLDVSQEDCLKTASVISEFSPTQMLTPLSKSRVDTNDY
jgi:threonine aldolase